MNQIKDMLKTIFENQQRQERRLDSIEKGLAAQQGQIMKNLEAMLVPATVSDTVSIQQTQGKPLNTVRI